MLNKDEVVKLADDAELTYCGGKSGFVEDADLTEYLMAFASAIWEKAVLTEREACAKLCDPKPPAVCSDHEWLALEQAADKIRDRSNV